MRRKLIFLVMLVAVLMMFAVPGTVFAKSLFYADNPSTLGVETGATLLAGADVAVGQCNVQSLTVSVVTAGQYVEVYDQVSRTGTPRFDIVVGVSADIRHINLNDAEFYNGIFVKSNAATSIITVGYTQ